MVLFFTDNLGHHCAEDADVAVEEAAEDAEGEGHCEVRTEAEADGGDGGAREAEEDAWFAADTVRETAPEDAGEDLGEGEGGGEEAGLAGDSGGAWRGRARGVEGGEVVVEVRGGGGLREGLRETAECQDEELGFVGEGEPRYGGFCGEERGVVGVGVGVAVAVIGKGSKIANVAIHRLVVRRGLTR